MSRRNKLIFTAIAILTVAVALVVLVELRLGSVRKQLSSIEAGNTAASALTKALDETLAQYKLNYDEIVDFQYDSDEKINSLTVDIIALNTFGNELGKNIDRNIDSFIVKENSVPISMLIGEQLLAGIGPDVKFYITMKGNSSSKFTDLFESAGVNQTRHKIMLDVTVEMYVVFSGMVETVTYKSNVCVAESILVGVTPSTFANLR